MPETDSLPRTSRIAAALEEAERLHGDMSRKTGGADPEWPLFYAWYLVEWSDLPNALGAKPSRSRLVYELVGLDREFRAEARQESWSAFYAERLASTDWAED